MSAARIREKSYHIRATMLREENSYGNDFSTMVLAPNISEALRIFNDVYPASEPEYTSVRVDEIKVVGSEEILVDFNITDRKVFGEVPR